MTTQNNKNMKKLTTMIILALTLGLFACSNDEQASAPQQEPTTLVAKYKSSYVFTEVPDYEVFQQGLRDWLRVVQLKTYDGKETFTVYYYTDGLIFAQVEGKYYRLFFLEKTQYQLDEIKQLIKNPPITGKKNN